MALQTQTYTGIQATGIAVLPGECMSLNTNGMPTCFSNHEVTLLASLPIEIAVSAHSFSNMASGRLAALLPVNWKPQKKYI